MSFSKQIRNWNRKAERNMQAAFRQSVQEVVELAQEPNPKAGGTGRMPVDTGFLINSGGAALNDFPTGPTDNPGGQVRARVTGMGLVEGLARWRPGDTFTWAWTAKYGPIMEARYGFMRGASERWQSIVKSVAARIR